MSLRSNTCAVTSQKVSPWVDVGTGTAPILAGSFAFSCSSALPVTAASAHPQGSRIA